MVITPEQRTWLEWLAVGFNLAFVVLLINERRISWWFGIAGSMLSVALFAHAKLYSEAILYFFYVIMGFYGVYMWRQQEKELHVSEISLVTHIKFMVLCVALALGLGAFFTTQTDAQKPFADAFSTIFGFFATYLEAKKIVSTWLYWTALNAFSIWLYQTRDLDVYAGLMGIYTVLSILGYLRWHKRYLAARAG